MPWATVVPLTIGAVALGSLFGALEVATVAFADDAGRKALSGLMLGAFALGSLLAGVVAGVDHLAARTVAARPGRHGPAGGRDAVPSRSWPAWSSHPGAVPRPGWPSHRR